MLLPAPSSILESCHRLAWHCLPQHGPVTAPLPRNSRGSSHSPAAMFSQEDEVTHARSGAANTRNFTGDNDDSQDRRQQRSKAASSTDESRQRLLLCTIGHAFVQCSSLPQASVVRLQMYVAEDKHLLQAYTLHSCTAFARNEDHSGHTGGPEGPCWPHSRAQRHSGGASNSTLHTDGILLPATLRCIRKVFFAAAIA